MSSNSAKAQRERLLMALRSGPVTTLEARSLLDILMPATRVHELRHGQGLNIRADWILRPTESGQLHRVAIYTLHPGKWRSV